MNTNLLWYGIIAGKINRDTSTLLATIASIYHQLHNLTNNCPINKGPLWIPPLLSLHRIPKAFHCAPQREMISKEKGLFIKQCTYAQPGESPWQQFHTLYEGIFSPPQWGAVSLCTTPQLIDAWWNANTFFPLLVNESHSPLNYTTQTPRAAMCWFSFELYKTV